MRTSFLWYFLYVVLTNPWMLSGLAAGPLVLRSPGQIFLS